MQTAHDGTNGDVGKGFLAETDGVDDTGVATSGDKRPIIQKQGLFFGNIVGLGTGCVAKEVSTSVFAGASWNGSRKVNAWGNFCWTFNDFLRGFCEKCLPLWWHGQLMDGVLWVQAEAWCGDLRSSIDRDVGWEQVKCTGMVAMSMGQDDGIQLGEKNSQFLRIAK